MHNAFHAYTDKDEMIIMSDNERRIVIKLFNKLNLHLADCEVDRAVSNTYVRTPLHPPSKSEIKGLQTCSVFLLKDFSCKRL